MIVPAEVQHAVDQQDHKFFFQWMARRLRLALGGRQRNDDVTEVRAGQVETMGCVCLAEGKRQDVGAAVLVPEPVVEPLHPSITDE